MQCIKLSKLQVLIDSRRPASEQGWAIGVVVACNGELKSSPSAPYLPPRLLCLRKVRDFERVNTWLLSRKLGRSRSRVRPYVY